MRDASIFEPAGYEWTPAGGGLMSWQRRVGNVVYSACDWHSEGDGWLIGVSDDGGGWIASNVEFDAVDAVATLERLREN